MQLNEGEKTELQRRIERSAAAQRVFESPDGELVLKEIRAFCGESFIFDPDPTTLAYRVGKRDVLLCIENMLKADVEKAKTLLQERLQERKDEK